MASCLFNRCDTLDGAQLAKRCPLDNGRHTDASIPPRYSAGQLDCLPPELLLSVLLSIDIPSLTRFRSVNRRAMDLVDSVPEYAAMIKRCPDVIRAVVSIQADAFDCRTLHATLKTSWCSTCEYLGPYLYLITCRRVCSHCFKRLPEYNPLTRNEALPFFTSNGTPQRRDGMSPRHRLRLANPPSVVSLPGHFGRAGNSAGERRVRLFDRRSVTQDVRGLGRSRSGFFRSDPPRESRRFMAVVTAPFLSGKDLAVDDEMMRGLSELFKSHEVEALFMQALCPVKSDPAV
ncbi:F-box domain-containing protein [Colletotrichum sojae]|uniref:F-box domain-containing protein n=1 Tax=Colletotrichum sojae TaxID=2175907 RepID=A0A8H6IR80_9PEZI|nr:F-box domain-containing protein [Colletotrichum sojae]